ncbi:predicted protein [Histoplasma capsulatum G186AR]|uniref:Uncharacterized protein n=1 Tax=Ajellomyces capsulatus (strain G186AR / H82 / ATCC MYA-2454 / RMSCC 2432) TaxID=447093 RepID=C0NQI4_AJECG|nr:uncharacterized protein HCBG_05772 [Histoplasma capsulatum G186AR]EEH06456.1 predicted protein [Histoplasma capsulatum G186AR]
MIRSYNNAQKPHGMTSLRNSVDNLQNDSSLEDGLTTIFKEIPEHHFLQDLLNISMTLSDGIFIPETFGLPSLNISSSKVQECEEYGFQKLENCYTLNLTSETVPQQAHRLVKSWWLIDDAKIGFPLEAQTPGRHDAVSIRWWTSPKLRCSS